MSNNLVSLVSTGAIIADCDGTIAPDVEKAHGICMANVIEDLSRKAGIEYSSQFFQHIWDAELGKGILNFTTNYVDSLDEDSTTLFMQEIESVENAENLYEAEYIRFSEEYANASYFQIRNGLGDLFRQAAQNGIPVAVLSNANQKVLEATLQAVFRHASLGEDLSSYLTVVMGKDTVEGLGYKAKPSRKAVYCVKDALEKRIGKSISLDNSIYIGDTENDYRASYAAGVGRTIACDNFQVAANVVRKPDSSGFLVIGNSASVMEAIRIYAINRAAHRHGPIPESLLKILGA